MLTHLVLFEVLLGPEVEVEISRNHTLLNALKNVHNVEFRNERILSTRVAVTHFKISVSGVIKFDAHY